MDDDKPYTVDGKRVTHQEYARTKYDDLRVRVLKGSREKIQAHATEKGMSLNAYIISLIEADMGKLEE